MSAIVMPFNLQLAQEEYILFPENLFAFCSEELGYKYFAVAGMDSD